MGRQPSMCGYSNPSSDIMEEKKFIVMENITKIYKMGKVELKVLDEVSLEIKKGEFVAILGPSGSGKSTLMNIIGCIDIPTSGEYILDEYSDKMIELGKKASIQWLEMEP